jgi:hypothetical protein
MNDTALSLEQVASAFIKAVRQAAPPERLTTEVTVDFSLNLNHPEGTRVELLRQPGPNDTPSPWRYEGPVVVGVGEFEPDHDGDIVKTDVGLKRLGRMIADKHKGVFQLAIIYEGTFQPTQEGANRANGTRRVSRR